MSSGKGGGGGSQEIKPVPQTKLQTEGYGGMGYAPVPQTYTQEGKPAWMQGVWDNPAWGMDASTMSAPGGPTPLTQQMMQPQAPPPGAVQPIPQSRTPNLGGKAPGDWFNQQMRMYEKQKAADRMSDTSWNTGG